MVDFLIKIYCPTCRQIISTSFYTNGCTLLDLWIDTSFCGRCGSIKRRIEIAPVRPVPVPLSRPLPIVPHGFLIEANSLLEGEKC